HRAGIKTVILPKENEKDLEEIPQHVRKKLRFVLVEHMDQVLAEALLAAPVAVEERILPPPVVEPAVRPPQQPTQQMLSYTSRQPSTSSGRTDRRRTGPAPRFSAGRHASR